MSEVIFKACDLRASQDVVQIEHWNAAQSELSALREELAESERQLKIQTNRGDTRINSLSARIGKNETKLKSLVDRNTRLKWQRNGVQLKLEAAEKRIADLIDVLEVFAENSDDRDVVEISRHQISLSQPTESGASE